MIATLPVSNIINENNYLDISEVRVLEYKKMQPLLDGKMESLFHSDLGILQKEFISYFDSIKDYLIKNRIKMFSFDLGPAVEDVAITDYYYSARSESLSPEKLKKIIYSRLNYIKERFHGLIALENLNYFPTPAYRYVCESGFISDIIRQNGVYMVLDIAHAIITSHNLKIDIREYLDSLPLETVAEIHLSAPEIKEGAWQDTHEAPGDRECRILGSIGAKLKREPFVVIEYYKNFSKLKQVYKDIFGGILCHKK